MKLYAIVITGVYPPQLANVSDSTEYANGLKDHLIESIPHLDGYIDVREVDSFYPDGYTEADTNINKFTKTYSK